MPKSSKKRKAGGRIAVASASEPSASSSSSSSSSPKKKKGRSSSASSSSSVIRVEVSPVDPGHDPVVVSFPRGVPGSLIAKDTGTSTGGGSDDDDDDIDNGNRNHNHRDKIDEEALPRFSCTRPNKPSSSSSSHRGLRLTGEDATCAYSASASGRGHDGRLTKAYVCVYDRKKKTLKLVPSAERGTIFALEQSVKGYTPDVGGGLFGEGGAGGGGGEGGGGASTSASDRVQMLVESFGSKKKQKVMASRAANRVNIHSVVGAGDVMMRSVASQGGISSENKKGMEEGGEVANPNDVAFEQARRKMLPPYDADADVPSKVYSAQSIAGDVAWDKISRIVTKILKTSRSDGGGDDVDDEENEKKVKVKEEEGGGGESSDSWVSALLGKKGNRPQSVVTLLESIDPDARGSMHRIKTAFLLFLTLKFHSQLQRRRSIEGASVDDCIGRLHVPHEVGLRLFELFASQVDGSGNDGKEGATGYAASAQQKTKLTAHILVLYAIASGKEMKLHGVNQLCRDMKIDTREASLVLRESGFVVKKNTSTGEVGAVLRVPLKFPPPKRARKT